MAGIVGYAATTAPLRGGSGKLVKLYLSPGRWACATSAIDREALAVLSHRKARVGIIMEIPSRNALDVESPPRGVRELSNAHAAPSGRGEQVASPECLELGADKQEARVPLLPTPAAVQGQGYFLPREHLVDPRAPVPPENLGAGSAACVSR